MDKEFYELDMFEEKVQEAEAEEKVEIEFEAPSSE